MDQCDLCGADAFTECDIDCVNWDIRYDEIYDFSLEHQIEDINEEKEVEWK